MYDEILTEDEKRFVSLIFLNQGCKLSADINSSSDDQPAVWEKPERLGLVKCVGSYKWVTTNKVSCTFVFDTPVCQQTLHSGIKKTDRTGSHMKTSRLEILCEQYLTCRKRLEALRRSADRVEEKLKAIELEMNSVANSAVTNGDKP